MLRVTDVDYLKDYQLRLTFSDGVVKDVDLEPQLTGKVFETLLDKRAFIQYGLTPFTIEWANGVDFAPEFLYSIGIEIADTTVAAEPAQKWHKG